MLQVNNCEVLKGTNPQVHPNQETAVKPAIYSFDGNLMTSESGFWSHYIEVVKAEGIGYFGRNLDTLWDALSGCGPGAPKFPCVFKIANSQAANPRLIGRLLVFAKALEPNRHFQLELENPL